MPEQKGNSGVKQIEDLFNEKASTWNGKYECGGALALRAAAFRELVARELSANAKVLDFGCGTGAIAAGLSDDGYRVTACDLAAKMIDAGKKIYGSHPIQWCLLPPNWTRLPFEDSTFDGIVASSVLEYLPDLHSVMSECHRVLRPHGVLIATVPNPSAAIRKIENIVRPVALMLNDLPGFGLIPKLHSFMTYLKCSRNRMSFDEWEVRGAQAHLKLRKLEKIVPLDSSLSFLVWSNSNKEAE